MKILFVACYSPIINNSAAIETLQYLNKLSAFDENEIHLLTVDFPEQSVYYDRTLFDLMDKKIKFHAISGGWFFNKIVPKKTKSEEATVKVNNFKDNMIKKIKKIKNSVIIPDMYFWWSYKASKYAVKLMEKEKFDVIFSMHEPPSSHLCSYRIKKKFKKVKWITYWSDPWVNDFTRQHSILIKKIIESSMERKVVKNADKYIFVTKENRDDYIKKYNKYISIKDTYLLNRGFDKKTYEEIALEECPKLINKEKINIVYAGEIFGKLRDISFFTQCLNKLKNENRNIYNKLNILFFGNIDDLTMKENLKKVDCVKVMPRIPFDEALKYMVYSDVLILFGNKNSKQIPAKIYDYFGTKSRILVIYGDNNDPVKFITDKNKKCLTCENNTSEIIKQISKIYYLYEKKSLKCDPDYRYEWNSIIEKLNSIIREE